MHTQCWQMRLVVSLLVVLSGLASSVTGAENNIASGDFASVSGGNSRSAPATDNWAAGALFSDQ